MGYDKDFNNVLAIWTAFNGVMGDDVRVEYEVMPFTFEIVIPSGGRDYVIRTLIGDDETEIDWGDGTIEPLSDFSLYTSSPEHEYKTGGTYTVVVKGLISDISFANGDAGGWQGYDALYRVLTPFPKTMSENTDLSYRFCHCMNLVSIPTDIFANCTAAEDFSYCFTGCDSLSIPTGLFTKNIKARSFKGLFYYKRANLTSIPSGLFDTNTLATDFSRCFGVCESLMHIPPGLFRNNHAASTFSECFYQCKAVSYIPDDLFASTATVTTFYRCFANCYSITHIPTTLFHYSPAVTSFQSCFEGCSGLVSLPDTLFAANGRVTTFERCFNNCNNLLSIPAGLFANNPGVTSFAFCFNGMRKLTSIPAGLFANNPHVTTFYYCFAGTYTYEYNSITSIPANLFANNHEVTTFSCCFWYGRKIISAVPELWRTHSSASGTSCFYQCKDASNYASIPSNWR